MPASSTSGDAMTVASQIRPMLPAPAMTTLSGSSTVDGIVRKLI
jgi:hypothetical protein